MSKYAEWLLADPLGDNDHEDEDASSTDLDRDRDRYEHELMIKRMELESHERIERDRLALEQEKLAIERAKLKQESEIKMAELEAKEHAENDETRVLKRYGETLAQVLAHKLTRSLSCLLISADFRAASSPFSGQTTHLRTGNQLPTKFTTSDKDKSMEQKQEMKPRFRQRIRGASVVIFAILLFICRLGAISDKSSSRLLRGWLVGNTMSMQHALRFIQRPSRVKVIGVELVARSPLRQSRSSTVRQVLLTQVPVQLTISLRMRRRHPATLST